MLLKRNLAVRQNLETKKKGTKVDDKWYCLKECFLEASDQVCGWTKGPVGRGETS